MIYLVSIVVGLLFGSFANVCIYRLPKEESLILPGSHCPHCKAPLRYRDNLPLLSFLLLKGKCRFCKAPISWQYPLVELSMAALFLMSALLFNSDLARVVVFDGLCFYLLTISVIDYRHKIIPDELSLSLWVLGWIVAFKNPYLFGQVLPAWLESLLASLTGGGVMMLFAWSGEKIFKKEALGGGDIKLMGAFGAVLGWKGLLGVLTLGSLAGAIWGGGLLLLRHKKAGDTIPYGPFLCLGALIYGLYPGWMNPFLSP